MSLRNVDIEGGLRRLADRRIEEAMAAGKFDHLPGAGQPLELEEPPADENAKLLWWALRIFKQNDVVPDEVKWRKALDPLRAELAATTSETRLRTLVTLINELCHKINTLGTNAIKLPGSPVDWETELARLRDRSTSAGR